MDSMVLLYIPEVFLVHRAHKILRFSKLVHARVDLRLEILEQQNKELHTNTHYDCTISSTLGSEGTVL